MEQKRCWRKWILAFFCFKNWSFSSEVSHYLNYLITFYTYPIRDEYLTFWLSYQRTVPVDLYPYSANDKVLESFENILNETKGNAFYFDNVRLCIIHIFHTLYLCKNESTIYYT